MRYPITPDGRYFVVRGRLWRMTNPSLPRAEREALVRQLMTARRAVGQGQRNRDAEAERRARAEVDAAKRRLGERGDPWWSDGAPDYNRRLAKNSCYADWFSSLRGAPRAI